MRVNVVVCKVFLCPELQSWIEPKVAKDLLCEIRVSSTDETHVVQFVVESAGVADGLAVLVAPPQRSRGRLAVGADRAFPTRGRLKRKMTISRRKLKNKLRQVSLLLCFEMSKSH
jgi:hypothetical protein